jgi:thymidylate synthase ThyX
MPVNYHVEQFSASERAILSRHVSNLDGPVFALVNLPQATCAALFARYSRSPKSLRRLLLDEFVGEGGGPLSGGTGTGEARASELFSRVLAEYGDDSVAQLAAVHIACEQVSQPLAKAIEWGRLMSYLEQSTRYIPYTDRRDGKFRYYVDPEVEASPLGAPYREAMDGLFATYSSLLEPLQAHLEGSVPPAEDAGARRRAIRALSLDVARGLLPAGTVSNLGVFGSAQGFEQMVLRLRAHPLPEARQYAELIATELHRVIPDFVTRLDRPDRGGAWADYLRDSSEGAARVAAGLTAGMRPAGREPEVRLIEWEADGEERVLTAALHPHTGLPWEAVADAVRSMAPEQRAAAFADLVGARRNRRHRPGRGLEHTAYTFEVCSDYGSFRDLQRHRMLTIHWQPLGVSLGYEVPEQVSAAGLGRQWRAAAGAAEAVHGRMQEQFPQQAAYLVTLAHRVRYVIKLNAREAMHMLELRTSPQGHPAYRRICREMHRQIDEVAGHRLIAGAMRFVGSDDVHLPRYAAEAARTTAP